FSFYGMKALLFLYLTKYHLFGDNAGYDVIGAYGGLVYAIPVIGGLLADRYLGMRKAVVFGGILLCLGHLGMAIEGSQATRVGEVVTRDESALLVFYGSLALIIVGVGFLKPNISTIVGRLYTQDDPRRDSGFSLFYAGINLGALFASLVCGYLGEIYGWSYGFGAAGIGMVLGLCMFLWGQRYLHGHAEPPDPDRLRETSWLGLSREKLIYLGSLLGLLPLAWLMWASANGAFSLGGHITLALAMMLVMLVGVLVWFMLFILRQCTPVERDRMIALMVLIFWALVFFTLYEQTYGSWVAFTDRLLTQDLFPSMVITEGTPLPWSIFSLILAPAAFFVAARLSDRDPASAAPKLIFALVFAAVGLFLLRDLLVLPQTAGSLTFLGAMFIVLLAPIFTGLWGWLDRFGANPSKPIKSAIGLVFAGLAFVPLALAAEEVGATGMMASVWWLVLAYLVLEIGEMCLSPVGLSAVTQLSVARVTSLMMGTWFLATAFSEALAALFGKLAAIEEVGADIDLVAASAKYADLFWLMTWIGLGCAVLAFAVAPLLKRWMHGVR
ncbi:MAG: peptide MFS transporter, partial [Xanthomonadales bacterium]|nr:peptide MFS transporter [Xanthomonadales bacterium]